MANRICAKCKRSINMAFMEKLGKDFVCKNSGECQDIHYERILSGQT